MQAKGFKKLIKESVKEVLVEDLSSNPHGRYAQEAGAGQFDPREFSVNEDTDSTALKVKKKLYAMLHANGFQKLGETPREYMEFYLNGFVTIGCSVSQEDNTVFLERYFDSERLDTMPGHHIEKKIPIPEPYQEEFVSKILLACIRMKRAAIGDESIFSGNDDDLQQQEGFDPTSFGPNAGATEGTQDDPYAAMNAKMRKMEDIDPARVKDTAGKQFTTQQKLERMADNFNAIVKNVHTLSPDDLAELDNFLDTIENIVDQRYR